MAATASPLKVPIQIIPPPLSLLHLHLKEFREGSIQAEETTTNKPKCPLSARAKIAMLTSPTLQRLSSASFADQSRLYWADVYRPGTSCSMTVCPERVFVTPIPLSGPTAEDIAAAISQFQLNLALNCGGSHQQFCFLPGGPAEDGDQNYVDAASSKGQIPNLHSSPPDARVPTTEFVGKFKSQNICKLTDYVLSYLAEISDEEMEEYWNFLISKTESQLESLDSIRIWNILTLGCEIQKAIAENGLIVTPIRLEDLGFPPPEELFPLPQQGWTAAANNKKAEFGHDFTDDNETLSDARNYGNDDGDSKGKRKVQHTYDDLQTKKPRHGGVLRID